MPHYQMPVYTHDHSSYIIKMQEWHIKMHHYHDQLKSYHLERARHFQKMMGERVLTSGKSDDDNVA